MLRPYSTSLKYSIPNPTLNTNTPKYKENWKNLEDQITEEESEIKALKPQIICSLWRFVGCRSRARSSHSTTSMG